MRRRFALFAVVAPTFLCLCLYACVGSSPVSNTPRPDAEVASTDGGTPDPSSGDCKTDEKRCGDRCVKIEDPLYGCSPTVCDPCPESAFVESVKCEQGNCKVATCTEGRADCDNKFAPNGCETDITSARACGACPPTGTCVPSATNCSPDGGGGYACTPTCSTGIVCGDAGACVSIDTSIAHCGACGNACPVPTDGAATCVAKVCGKRCLPGMTLSADGKSCITAPAGVCLADGTQKCALSQQCCSGSCARPSTATLIRECIAPKCSPKGSLCGRATICCNGGTCSGAKCT
jgi:hypothetical protein